MGEKYSSAGDVARLFGRAAFGATAADLDTWTGKPYADVVDHLLDIPPLAQRPAFDDALRLALQRGDTLDGGTRIFFFIEQGQQWWLERMRTTAYPLEERMTLFWHDHFATGPTDKGTTLGALITQNQLLRTHSLGNFRAMCEEITLDPAMLFWLDGAFNSSIAPNENYAREFFELFTLGTIPQVYTEKDIRESAKALTGWTVDPFSRIPFFNEGSHSQETKTVLGRTVKPGGNVEYKQIVDVALDHPVAPYFVAYKLVLNFAYVPKTRDLLRSPGPLIDRIAKRLRSTKWNLREGVRTMLLADEFRYASPAKSQQVVRQPIELVVHACKALGVGAMDQRTTQTLVRMGQSPFVPPNVGGWPFGKDWLSPATFLARYDWGILAYELYNNALVKDALPPVSDVKAWLKVFGLARLSKNTDATIRSYLMARKGAPEAELQTGLLALIVSSPDWMVM
jgi:uncharacterized protein (DUF1800 family)